MTLRDGCLQIVEAGAALAATEAAASEAAGEASAEETVEDLEGATKWEEGGSMLAHNHQGAQAARAEGNVHF